MPHHSQAYSCYVTVIIANVSETKKGPTSSDHGIRHKYSSYDNISQPLT